jgi:hypothetical protein
MTQPQISLIKTNLAVAAAGAAILLLKNAKQYNIQNFNVEFRVV